MMKIKDVFTLQMGKTPARAKSEYYENGTNKWVSISDLSTYEKHVDDTKEHLTDIAVKESGIKLVPANTVIMSFKLSIGKTAITRESTYTNEAIMAFIPNNPETIIPDYLYYSFSGRDWENGTNRAVMGATLNKATIGELQIDIPDLNTQRAVVERMDKVSELIDLRKRQLAKLDELVKARFVEMFGDPLTGTAKWPIQTVGDVAEAVDPQPSHRTPPEVQNGVPYISIKDCDYKTGNIDFENARKVSANVLEEHINRYTLHEGDFIIGKIGTIGNPIFVPARKDYTLSANIVLVQPDSDKVSPYFLKYSFMSDFIERQFDEAKNSTSQAAFGIQKVRAIKILKPELEVQKEFETFVKQLDKLKSTVQQSLDKLETLKKSLMQEYFG